MSRLLLGLRMYVNVDIFPEPFTSCVCLCHVEWYWKVWVLPWLYRIGAVLLGALSVAIVWCEMTFSIYINSKVRISVLAAVMYSLHEYGGNYIPVEVRTVIRIYMWPHGRGGEFHCIRVVTLQGVGLEGVHCIQRWPHFRVLG